jgi:hypothetical protein
MWSKKQFTSTELSQLCQDALDNWDADSMSVSEIRTLRYYADNPGKLGGIDLDENPGLARSFNDEWDWVAELASATDWN